jgi:two-component system chemotaxis sensor kinase CheA
VNDLTEEFLAESLEGLDRMEQCLTQLERSPADTELLAEIFRAVHTIKGGTGFLGAVRSGHVAISSALIDALLALLDRLRLILALIQSTGSEGHRSSDDDFDLIATLISLNAEGVPVSLASSSLEATVLASTPLTAEPLHAADLAERRTLQHYADRTVRVEVETLNRMMNLVAELVLTRNSLLQNSTRGYDPHLARRLDRVTTELRETVMQARMQPIGNLFGKFPRMVRDLAELLGRRVRIEFDGQHTGLDKGLLEAIRDPLTHAVRNALDHGIETPEVRISAGKPAEGLLRLHAFHHNGEVVIELSDDGAGISPDTVLRKALERGLVSPEQARAMSQAETLELIFRPGFSTACAITSISGRGVGMDIVRANIERVGGSVEIASQPGIGTTLRLHVPLTLAIMPTLLVRSGGQVFALPQSAVAELHYLPLRDQSKAIESIAGAEFLHWRDTLIPLLRLDRILQLDQLAPLQGGGVTLAVVQSGARLFAIVVDELLAPEEVVVKPLVQALQQVGLFAGAAVLGSGTLTLILDIAGIGERAGVRPSEVAPAPALETVAASAALPPEERAALVCEVHRHSAGSLRREELVIPLACVDRIEQIDRTQIEFIHGQPMLRSRGQILPVVAEQQLLHDASLPHPIAIICTRQSSPHPHTFALLVERVLDICDRIDPRSETLLAGGATVTSVNGHLAVIEAVFAASAPLQEVA